MTPAQSLETVALLAKNLRKFSPVVAALGRNRKQALSVALLQKAGELLSADTEAREELLRVVENLLGSKLDTLDWKRLARELPEAWKRNEMEQALRIAIQLRILDKSDLANFYWVQANWQ